MSERIPYHGNKPIDLVVDEQRAEQLKTEAFDWQSVTLTGRQVNELELLLNGGLSPLSGYMSQSDYRSVLQNHRLTDGTLFPMPLCLDISPEIAEKIQPGDKIALRDPEGFMPAVLDVAEIWQADLEKENSELKKEVRELKQLLTEERDLRNAVAGNTSLSGETDTNGSSQGSSRHGQVKFKEEQNGIAKSTPNDGVVGDAGGNDGINNVSLCNGMEKKSEISWSKILNPDG